MRKAPYIVVGLFFVGSLVIGISLGIPGDFATGRELLFFLILAAVVVGAVCVIRRVMDYIQARWQGKELKIVAVMKLKLPDFAEEEERERK